MLKCLHYVLIIGFKNMELTLDDFWTKTQTYDGVLKETNLKVETPTNLELSQTIQRLVFTHCLRMIYHVKKK